MPVQLKDLQDKAKYKKLLKEELTTLKAAPAVFHYFEKFKFNDGKLGPLMLVGDLMRKDLFESVKDTDAPIKARGKCAKAGDEVHFQVELGALPLDKLKADMSNVEAKEVTKLADAGGAAPADDKALKGAAEAKHVLVTQQFDAIKGRVSDETRKAMRDIFGRVDDAMKAGKYGDALTAMKAVEAACAKAGNELRQDKEHAAGAVSKEFDAQAGKARVSLHQATTLEAEVKRLVEEIKDTDQKAGVAGSRKGAASQQKALQLQNASKALKASLDDAKEAMGAAQKIKDADQNVIKELAKQLMAAQATYDLAAKALAVPGKLADNADMKAAGEAIKGKVGEMGDAAKFQKEQLEGAGHGTGRHGAQTGLDKQAGRISSDVTPDQPSNPSGAPMLTAQWKTTIKWKEDPTGKRVVDKPAVIVQKVIDEVSSTNATSMTSTFLNPVVEQEAVTRAIDIAKAQCKWTQWQDGANWKDLLNLTIIVPPPRTAKGYGLAVERGEGFAKKSAAAAAGFIKDFETGKIKTIDELMKKLDVQLVPDRHRRRRGHHAARGGGAHARQHRRAMDEQDALPDAEADRLGVRAEQAADRQDGARPGPGRAGGGARLHAVGAALAARREATRADPRSRDDSFLAQARDVGRREAHFGQDRVGVVAEVRRRRAHAARRARELGHDARHLDVVAVARVLREDHVAGTVVRVFGDVLRGEDLARWHLRLVERGHRLGDAARRGPLADGRVDLRDARDATGVAREVGGRGQIGAADLLHQPLEDAVAVAGHEHIAVAARIGVRRRDAGQRAARGFTDRAERAVFRNEAFHDVEHRLVQRHVDHLAEAAVDLVVIEREQHADRAVQRRQRVADGDAAAHRHATRLAGEVAQAAHRLADDTEAGPVTIRAGLAIARDAQDDEAGVDRGERVGPETPAFERAGAKVLDQHIGLGDQPAREVLAFGLAQVERQRPLVARLHLPPDRRAVLQQPPVAQRIPGTRRLDLDHLGTELAEQLAGERTGDELTHLDDAHALQGRGKLTDRKRRAGLSTELMDASPCESSPHSIARYATGGPSIMSRTRFTSAVISNGLVITAMPRSRWPLPTAAFSA